MLLQRFSPVYSPMGLFPIVTMMMMMMIRSLKIQSDTNFAQFHSCYSEVMLDHERRHLWMCGFSFTLDSSRSYKLGCFLNHGHNNAKMIFSSAFHAVMSATTLYQTHTRASSTASSGSLVLSWSRILDSQYFCQSCNLNDYHHKVQGNGT